MRNNVARTEASRDGGSVSLYSCGALLPPAVLFSELQACVQFASFKVERAPSHIVQRYSWRVMSISHVCNLRHIISI